MENSVAFLLHRQGSRHESAGFFYRLKEIVLCRFTVFLRYQIS